MQCDGRGNQRVDSVDALAVASARSSSDSPESDELASLSPSPPSLLPSPAFPPVSSFVISSFAVAADESSFFAIAPSVERMDVTFVPTSPVTSSRQIGGAAQAELIMLSVWEISVRLTGGERVDFGLTFVA